MGDEKFFTYNAVSNNCQDFLLAFLQSNNLGNNENYTFLKQDTESLFKRLPVLQKIAKSTTDFLKNHESTLGHSWEQSWDSPWQQAILLVASVQKC